MKVRRARFRGTVERFADAIPLLARPGDFALVARGVPRMLVFACPEGCGDILPINLDPRAGKSWRYYNRDGINSLYPSVWRDEGCEAHFILWNDIIYWNGLGLETTPPEKLRQLTLSKLTATTFATPLEIAAEFDEIPWIISIACGELVRRGLAEEGTGKFRGSYRLRR